MMKGFQGHFKNKTPKQSKPARGITGTDDYANADIIQQYYQGVYSQEVSQAIKHTASKKAPGQTVITTDTLKNQPPEAFTFLTKIIKQYWTNPECMAHSPFVYYLQR